MGLGVTPQVNRFERVCGGHTDPLPKKQTDTTENIAFPQLILLHRAIRLTYLLLAIVVSAN